MAVKRGGLGPRDLSFFISEESADQSAVAGHNNALMQLTLDAILPGQYQPRQDMDPVALQELANSIQAQGIIQPIVVRPLDDKHYEIIAGERRYRAARLAGLTQVPVVIKDISDQAAMAIALIENIQRENLNPMEEAYALQRLIEEFGLTHEQVAANIGKSRATVTNLLRLLSLENSVKIYLQQGDLELGHAKVLLALNGDAQIAAAQQVIARGLSVRETEKLIQDFTTHSTLTARKLEAQRTLDPDLQKLERRLAERLGASVTLKHKINGKGKLVIQYNSLDELDGILEHIQ